MKEERVFILFYWSVLLPSVFGGLSSMSESEVVSGAAAAAIPGRRRREIGIPTPQFRVIAVA